MFGVRTRILAWYFVLMAIFAVLSILAIRQAFFVRLEERIEKSQQQELKEFRRTVSGRNPSTGEPFGNDIAAIFDRYLSRNFPEENEYFITLLNGQFYQSSAKALPLPLQPNSELVKRWAKLAHPEQGTVEVLDDTIIYLVEPIIRGKTHGVFVVAQLTAREHQQIDEAVFVIIEVICAVLAIAALPAWISSGRVLAPLRLLTDTARSISESDLNRRIPVKGSDEIAELTITFNEMLDRLQTAFASQRDFINDASHELQTPIAIIQGHLDMMGDAPEERRETLAIVTDELGRMSRFVDDLLLLARAEQPDFLMLETVEIGALTEELYAKAIALAPRNWRLESKVSVNIVADRQRLTQAIMNLAQNATQHTKEGDTIALGSKLSGNNVRLWVRDTGRGIALTEQKRIFERFARSSNSRRRSKGAGLGLSIVSAIAQAHGGQVKLFSRPGGGSTFTLVVPIEPPTEIVSHEPNSHSRR